MNTKTMTAVVLLLAFTCATAAAADSVPALRSQFMAAHPGAAVHMFGGSSRVPSMVTGLNVAVSADPGAGAAMFVTRWAPLFGLDTRTGTVTLSRVVSFEGRNAYRLAQYYKGLPVVGADAVVTTGRDGKIIMVSNGLSEVGDISVDFASGEAAAIDAAINAVSPDRWERSTLKAERSVALVGGEYAAVWVVGFFSHEPFGSWRVLLDRNSAAVLGVENLAKTAKGYAFTASPEAGAYEEVTLTGLVAGSGLAGTYVDVYSGYGTRQAKADASGNFLYKPAEGNSTDPFAEVTSFYNLNRMHDYFKDNGFDSLDKLVRVSVNNYTNNEESDCNAGSSVTGNWITVGLCKQVSPAVNFAYDADVVMHEYTHSGVSSSADLAGYSMDSFGMYDQPYSMHEGYADFFPAVVTGEPRIGRHVAKAFGKGGYLRNIDAVYKCPADFMGEAHEDGKIWSGANWAAYKAQSFDPEVARAVLLGLPTLSTRASFADAAQATLTVAESISQTVKDALSKAYTDRGVIDCSRIYTAANNKGYSGYLLTPGRDGLNISGYSTTPFVVQYMIEVPEGALRLDVITSGRDLSTGAGATGKLNVHVRYGSSVTFGTSVKSDWSSAGKATLSINAPKAGQYYILVVGTSFGSSPGYMFTVRPNYVTAETPDAGVVEEDGGVVEEDGGVIEDDAGEVDSGLADGGIEPTPDAGEIGTDGGITDDAGDNPPLNPPAGCVCATTSLSAASNSNGWLEVAVAIMAAGACVTLRKRRR